MRSSVNRLWTGGCWCLPVRTRTPQGNAESKLRFFPSARPAVSRRERPASGQLGYPRPWTEEGLDLDQLSWAHAVWATSLGALSAVSLPLGSLVGLSTRPRPQLISILAAFGAGALIAALSVELVAPTVSALHHAPDSSHHGDLRRSFVALLIGLALGGVTFVVLDQLVNARGGFLRKTATSISHFMVAERRRQAELVERLARLPNLSEVPVEHINTLVAMVRPRHFLDGEILKEQEERADAVLHVLDGTVRVMRDGIHAMDLGPGESFGVLAVASGIPYQGTAIAKGPVRTLTLSAEDFAHLRTLSPELDAAFRRTAEAQMGVLEGFETSRSERTREWARDAKKALRTGAQIPTAEQLQRAKREHAGAPLAVWLGILIDGIPESLVIGAGLLVAVQSQLALGGSVEFLDVVPYTLVAGLFLSNYPEALASSATMKVQGWSRRWIFLMWFSLMVVTAIGSGLGYLLAGSLDPTWLVLAEGVAAGAMLTMIASAMIPEAVHLGNANSVGLSTLTGFLAAIAFKLLE